VAWHALYPRLTARRPERPCIRVRRDYQDERITADNWAEQRPMLAAEIEPPKHEATNSAHTIIASAGCSP
jgi:hypothetical protein